MCDALSHLIVCSSEGGAMLHRTTLENRVLGWAFGLGERRGNLTPEWDGLALSSSISITVTMPPIVEVGSQCPPMRKPLHV